MRPTIGIIGGTGPLATLDIERKILAATQKLVNPILDQEYFNIIVFNYASIYDRNDDIFIKEACPLTQYIKYVASMASLGADLILIACNTAHKYLSILQEKTTVPIISIIDEVAEYIKLNFTGISKVGLLSTTTTYKNKLYHEVFSNYNIEIVAPSHAVQSSIMQAIYLIKSGIDLNFDDKILDNKNWRYTTKSAKARLIMSNPNKSILLEKKIPNPKIIIEEAITQLQKKDCHHIILGCTELPLVLPYLRKLQNVHLIDPNLVIAASIVETLQNMEKKGENRKLHMVF